MGNDIRLADVALAQIDALLRHYTELNRDEAARNLLVAVGQAMTKIAAEPGAGLPFPRPYRAVARWGFRWIKIHRYWIAYVQQDGGYVIVNILFESADIPRRIAPYTAGEPDA